MAKNNSNIPLSVVGKSVPIKDAREKVTGSLKYGVDFQVPNMVYGKILRSPQRMPKSEESITVGQRRYLEF